MSEQKWERCPKCGGTGVITEYDWVPYGSTSVQMASENPCSCVLNEICPGCSNPLDLHWSDDGAFVCEVCGMAMDSNGNVTAESRVPKVEQGHE